MSYLLDTCVISELFKPKPNQNLTKWIESQEEYELYVSVLTFGEIEKGIEKVSDENRKEKIKLWVEEDLKNRFEGRIIPLDLDIAIQWGRIQGSAEQTGKPMPAIDGLIAASGLAYDLVVVTRNTKDMQQSGVQLLDPWELKGADRL
ncbi:MAG: type II toxin-antitoxin system VapC family toxin [Gammaproteobacteria bacterium]|nr:type II toxin-antitoxin system VapC family toxin [Gammaproteobacteria bacterium]MDH5628771.1 type II toxin-antitoxin system VapC family toxin [Gammaproteobacteria bacterium]